MTDVDELPLWLWAAEQSERRAAEVVDLGAFRERSARWRLEIEPRAQSVGVALRTLDRALGIEAAPPIGRLTERRPA